MDNYQVVCDLLRGGAYMQALTHIWQRLGLGSYVHLSQYVRDNGLDLDVYDIVCRACREAVDIAWHGERDHARSWVDTLLNRSAPSALIDHGEGDDPNGYQNYRDRMIHAYLQCTCLLLDMHWTAP